MCLCRSHYAKATKDQSYTEMNLALMCAQKVRSFSWKKMKRLLTDDHGQALHIAPHDKAVLYNIAMMMQKAAEMMFNIPLAKRQIEDLESAIEQGAKAQRFVTPFDSHARQKLTIERQTIHFFGC